MTSELVQPTACVVLDLDDTLFLERDYVRSGFEAVSRYVEDTLGVAGFFQEVWSAFERGERGRLFDASLAALGVRPVPSLITTLVDTYRSHEPQIALLPDAAECVTVLGRAGTVLAVVTDGPLVSQQAKARALAVDRWAKVTVFTSELGGGCGKPHPAGFQAVEQVTGMQAGDCLYVADNPHKDFEGPAGLGWRTARVRRAGSLHELVPSGPFVEREDPDLWWLVPAAVKEDVAVAHGT